jgi:hypothetical protein
MVSKTAAKRKAAGGEVFDYLSKEKRRRKEIVKLSRPEGAPGITK